MRFVCQICGYIYDEAAEKTPFAALPDTWKCPLCRAPKSEFAPEEVPTASVEEPVFPEEEADLQKLSAGQLAALCSNLARGCEKQYKAKEAEWFRELADYFTAVTPPVNDVCVESVASLLQEDIDSYGTARSAADRAGDRGAARVCVWGERVTRMLSSLVGRYLREGEAMLADAEIWICTVCGFVYVGKEPPEQCPVCRVPAWKFEKIEGRAKG